MIATHNIKVNDRWYRAGEEYELETVKAPKKVEKVEKPVEEPKAPEAEAPVIEEAPKPKTTRRKKVSE